MVTSIEAHLALRLRSMIAIVGSGIVAQISVLMMTAPQPLDAAVFAALSL